MSSQAYFCLFLFCFFLLRAKSPPRLLKLLMLSASNLFGEVVPLPFDFKSLHGLFLPRLKFLLTSHRAALTHTALWQPFLFQALIDPSSIFLMHSESSGRLPLLFSFFPFSPRPCQKSAREQQPARFSLLPRVAGRSLSGGGAAPGLQLLV